MEGRYSTWANERGHVSRVHRSWSATKEGAIPGGAVAVTVMVKTVVMNADMQTGIKTEVPGRERGIWPGVPLEVLT
jgi:hypothetical protein